jgi:hypothetical protein
MLRDEPLAEEPAGLRQRIGERRRVLPDIVASVKVWRARRIKAVPGAGIDLHLQHVPVGLNRIAPLGATGRWGPIVGIADKDQRVGFKRPTGWVAWITTGVKGNSGGESRFVRPADEPGKYCLRHRPPAMREADHPDSPGTNLGRGAQIGGTVEGIARLASGGTSSPRLHTS